MQTGTIWIISGYLVIAGGLLIGSLMVKNGDKLNQNVSDRLKDEQVQKRETSLNEKIDGLVQGNEKLQEKLKPFENLANKMYPGIETDAALGRLSREIQDVKKETQPTVLIRGTLSEKELLNGSFEYTFNLEPEGKNVIPRLSISVESIDGVKINSIDIQGETLPLTSTGSRSGKQTKQTISYVSVPPASFKVTINTDKKTQLKIKIEPEKIGNRSNTALDSYSPQ
jgi:hypothetical protein